MNNISHTTLTLKKMKMWLQGKLFQLLRIRKYYLHHLVQILTEKWLVHKLMKDP